MPKYDIVGRRFGRLLVLQQGEYYVPPKGHPQIRWECVCDCGNKVSVLSHSLRSGKTKSCGCITKERQREKRSKPDGESAFNQVYLAYQQRATRKGYPFSLSKDQFKEETQKSCFYCGDAPSSTNRSSPNGHYVYNGLDRVDNSKGYEEGNVVPCCEFCNKAKRAHSLEYFEEKVVKMYKTLIVRKYLEARNRR